jgi:ribonuclease P protein subunit POP4
MTTKIEIAPEDLPYHELIGLAVWVDSSCDPTFNGLFGIVVDETRNTFIIETQSGGLCLEKTVPKKGSVFVFEMPEGISQNGRVSVKLDGNIMLSQPQNRIKNLKKSRK